MTRQGMLQGFVLAVGSSAIAGLIVWGVTTQLADRGTPRQVPSVVGLSLEDAMGLMVRHNFLPVEAEQRITGEHPPRTVLEQKPAPERLAVGGATIELVVEAESVEVPDLQGVRIEEAIARLSGARLAVGSVRVQPPRGESTGMVIDQDPAAHQRALPGATIAMVLEGARPTPPGQANNGESTRPTITIDPRILENIEIRRPPAELRPNGAERQPTREEPSLVQIRPRISEGAPAIRPEFTEQRFALQVITPATPKPIAPTGGVTLRAMPRTTTLQWEGVAAAASYTVQVDVQSGESWLSDTGRTYILRPGIKETTYTFDFVGAQTGRWRVWAVSDAGIASPKSAWHQFRYDR